MISNNGTGIAITGGVGAVIEGNYIGTTPDGEGFMGSSFVGIDISGGTAAIIGGTGPGTRNVISGFDQEGIVIAGATNVTVQGNLIGPNASQTSVYSGDTGVELDTGADNNTIGTPGAGANVIAGAGGDVGILLFGGDDNTVSGNFIGTDTNGTPFATTNGQGVRMINGSTGNTLTHNRISTSNDVGVELDSEPNTVSGNRIDSNDSGGIAATVGGNTIGPGNTIANNQSFGVRVSFSNGTRITQNSIDGTGGGLGIDLVGAANNRQSAPVLSSAPARVRSIQVQGSLTSAASTSFTLEFFRSQSCNGSGNGEGGAFLGSSTQSTDGSGNLSFNLAVPASGNGQIITATATDPAGNTSGFSTCATMSGTAASSFVVTAQDDQSGACTVTHCSLREAIDAANATAGTDKIAFDIEPAGLWTIAPTSQLPSISDPVTIDGTTQPGTAPNTPGIALDGTNAGNVYGLDLAGGAATIRGLAIDRFGASGILLESNGNKVQGSYLGLDPTGTLDRGNGASGILVLGAASNTIGGTAPGDRNVISGNDNGGIIFLNGASAGNVIEGNYIGLNAAGNAAVPNQNEGIYIDGPNNTVGGTTAAARNVISAAINATPTHGDGVSISGATATGNVVEGNYIGTDATGTLDFGNAIRGVLVNANGNTIGGTTAGARNVVSGNDDAGVEVSGGTGNAVEGNYVGLASDGVTALKNTGAGVQIDSGSGNTIGGLAAGAGNVISGNGTEGVVLNASTTGNTIQGNLIGTDKTGTLDRGNLGTGLLISSASDTTIGGLAAGAGNTIAFSGIDGIEITTTAAPVTRSAATRSSRTTESRTQVSGSTWTASDVGPFGVIANDPGDPDTGANDLQNFPVITQATSAVGTTIDGTLNSVAATTYHLDFYSNPTCDPSGYGEGQLYVGSQDVTTNGTGDASFSATFPSVTVASGDAVSATATDPAGNTSEFAQCATVNGGSAGSLTGAVQPDPAVADVNLSALGTEDWAIWGSAANGTSTSLAPNSRKLGANEISSLTNIDPSPSVVLRGLGQFPAVEPFYFGWANGTTPMNAAHVAGGIQHDGEQQSLSTLNHGFGFDVPANTQTRTLRVYVATNRADGTLTATLSDGSAGPFVDVLPQAVNTRSAVYTITYAAASAGQTLHVDWVETADNCSPPHDIFYCDNAAIYAVALQAPQTYVVNTNVDHDDGTCNAADCSLREAINAANAAAAPGVAGITFAFPGGGAQQIAMIGSGLPTITVPVAIDGTTEPGAPAGTMGVTLNGDGAGHSDGLVLGPGSAGSTIRGLAIRDFNQAGQAGIRVQSNGNQVIGNYLGTGDNGLIDASDFEGVVLEGDKNTVGGPNAGDRNVIAGNSDAGVLVNLPAGAPGRERRRRQLHRARRHRTTGAPEHGHRCLGGERRPHGCRWPDRGGRQCDRGERTSGARRRLQLTVHRQFELRAAQRGRFPRRQERDGRRIGRRCRGHECRLQHDRRQRDRRRGRRNPDLRFAAEHRRPEPDRLEHHRPGGTRFRCRERRDLDVRRALHVHGRCHAERDRRSAGRRQHRSQLDRRKHRGRLGLESGVVQHGQRLDRRRHRSARQPEHDRPGQRGHRQRRLVHRRRGDLRDGQQDHPELDQLEHRPRHRPERRRRRHERSRGQPRSGRQ